MKKLFTKSCTVSCMNFSNHALQNPFYKKIMFARKTLTKTDGELHPSRFIKVNKGISNENVSIK